MAHLAKQRDPADLRLPELFEPFYPIKFVSNNVIAIMRAKPIVKRCSSSRPGYFNVLAQANSGGFGCQTHVAICVFRPKSDSVDNPSGRKYRCHENLPSATSRHNMQLTQFSTSVPSSAIWRRRM
jgi:hypothetical protein